MDLVKEYLQAYNSLTNPTNSREANRKLIEIEESDEAWKVAHELINYPELALQIHGCQLLSKKLNKPLPKAITSMDIISFLYSQQSKTKTHWLCIAKTLIHMNPSLPMIDKMNMPLQEWLKLLQQIPSAISQIHTDPPLDPISLKRQYFDSSLKIFSHGFQTNTSQVLGCIQEFVTSGTRMNNSELLLRMLSLQISVVGAILQEVLEHQSYPQLQDCIIEYLNRHETNEQIFPVHIAFYRNTDLDKLSTQQFKRMLLFVLTKLRSKESEASVVDTYQFWHDLFQHITASHTIAREKVIIYQQAMLSLWELVCNKAKLKQLPAKTKVASSSLAINLDDSDQQKLQLPLQQNNEPHHFRSYAGDFVTLIIQTLNKAQGMKNQLCQYLTDLSRGDLLQFQLSIYLLVTIAESIPQNQLIRQPLIIVLSRQNDLNQYLCSKTIDLVGKMYDLFNKSPELLPEGLNFLAKCLQFSSLSPLASESCCELLDQAKPQNSPSITSNMQIFVKHLYTVLFKGQIKNKVIQNLSKAMVIYIFKFQHEEGYYEQYLKLFAKNIEEFQQTAKVKYIESAIVAHYWINARDQQKYLKSFEQFLELEANFMLNNIFTPHRKPALTEAINLFNLALKTHAVSKIELWCRLVDQILKRYSSVQPIMPIVFTPLINLAKSALYLQKLDIIQCVLRLINAWIGIITLKLGDLSRPKIEFNLSNMVLQLHLILLDIFIIYPTLSNEITYSPEDMLVFISSHFNHSQFWQYQLYKNSLRYYLLALKLGAHPQPILNNLICNFKKIGDTLWTSLEPILYFVFKKYGKQIFYVALKEANSNLDESNPLSDILMNSLEKSQGKIVKNILLSLC